MKRQHLTIYIILAISVYETFAQRLESPLVDSLMNQGIDLVMRQEYDRALSVFRQISQVEPESPIGLLYQAAVIQARSADYNLKLNRHAFDSVLTAADLRVKSAFGGLAKKETEAKALFFAGSILGYESYISSEEGDWFRAITKGLAAVSKYREALKRDSTLYDSNVGLGTYLYWKSRKIYWLPFVSDDRKEGIQLLIDGYTKGIYNRFMAASSLVMVLTNAGDFQRAVEYSDQVLRIYPRNRHFLWAKAYALEKWGKKEEAILGFERYLSAVKSDITANSFGELSVELKLAELFWKTGDQVKAKAFIARVLHYRTTSFSMHLREQVEEKIKRAGQLKTMVATGTGSR